MQIIFQKRARGAGLAMLLAGLFFLLPAAPGPVTGLVGSASAWAAGDQDCGVPQGYGTTNPFTANRSTCGLSSMDTYAGYSAQDRGQSGTLAPCESCRMGASGTGYEPQYVAPCQGQWCANGK